MKENDFKSLSFTVLGRDSEFEGDIKLRGDAMINSRLIGTVTMQDDGNLVIERNAYVEGAIYCKDVEVFGEVNGTINAAGSLVVRSSGKVSGKVSAASMSVYPGALLNAQGSADPADA